MTVSQTLADFLFQMDYADLPEAAIRAAKLSLIDTLSVGIAGRTAPGAREIVALTLCDGGRHASSVWTYGERVPARAAVFANSFLSGALDFDSLHPDTAIHPDIVIVPTAVAVAEDRRSSGKELITAVALGDDLMCRLGLPTRRNSGWFYTSIYGPIAGAAVTAKLLGASPERIVGAMGLGSMSASGTQQPAVERSMGKRLQGAAAAAAGISAGYLGASGIDGPREFIEGRFALYKMYEEGDTNIIIDELGTRFENMRITYKCYPSCQCNHAAIEGMLELRSTHGLDHGEVAAVEVFVSPYMHRLVGAPFDPRANPQVAAQFSIQYSIAAILLYGCLGVEQIMDNAVLDRRIATLASRVRVVVDSANTHNYAPVRFKITMRGGQVIEHEVPTYRGSLDWPLAEHDIKEKLAMCIEATGRHAQTADVDRCFDAIMNIESEVDVTKFVQHIFSLH